MMMHKHVAFFYFYSAIWSSCLITLQADMIANWKELSSLTPVTAGLNTDSPSFGDGTASSAQSLWMTGRFGTVATPASVNLAVGQTLIVSGQLVISGGAGAGNQYRFGVFDDGGKFDSDETSDWPGGWIHQADTDIFKARTTGTFISTTGNAVAQGATKTSTGTFNKNSTNPFTWNFSITRDTATTIDLVSSLTGGDGALDQEYRVDDVTTSVFTYTTAAWLFGGSSSVDQGTFSNVAFNVLPEPASAWMFVWGAGLIAALRHRVRRSVLG
jgi:hypothetical protein